MPARLTLARLAVVNGKPADAVPQLQRVLKEQPNNSAAALMLAELYAREFRYDQAIAVLEAAIRGSAESTTPTLVLADLYIRSGSFDDAIARLAPLLKNDPTYVPAQLLTGQAYLAKGDLSSAIGQFETVTRLNPRLFDGHYQLARALLARGDREGAKKNTSAPPSSPRTPSRSRIELAARRKARSPPARLANRGAEGGSGRRSHEHRAPGTARERLSHPAQARRGRGGIQEGPRDHAAVADGEPLYGVDPHRAEEI